MIDAHQSCRPARYCRYTAHPQWNRPLFHVPKLRAGADCTEIACSGLTESQASRGGECSPDPGCGFQNSDDRIHVGGSGHITRPCHPCGMLMNCPSQPTSWCKHPIATLASTPQPVRGRQSVMPGQGQISGPGNSPKERPLPTWPGLRWGWPAKTLFPASPIPCGDAVT